MSNAFITVAPWLRVLILWHLIASNILGAQALDLPEVPNFLITDSDFSFDRPWLTEDGKQLFFLMRNYERNTGPADAADLWSVQRLPSGQWSGLIRLPPPINTDAREELIGLGPRGDWLGLVRYIQPTPLLLIAIRENRRWTITDTLMLPRSIEFDQAADFQLDAQANVLFFSYPNPTQRDLFVCRRLNRTTLSPPERLPAPINSAANESHPFLAVDGQTFYFMSDRRGGVGKSDWWMSRATNTDFADWSEPNNLQSFNSEDDEVWFAQSTQTKKVLCPRAGTLQVDTLPNTCLPEAVQMLFGRVIQVPGYEQSDRPEVFYQVGSESWQVSLNDAGNFSILLDRQADGGYLSATVGHYFAPLQYLGTEERQLDWDTDFSQLSKRMEGEYHKREEDLIRIGRQYFDQQIQQTQLGETIWSLEQSWHSFLQSLPAETVPDSLRTDSLTALTEVIQEVILLQPQLAELALDTSQIWRSLTPNSIRDKCFDPLTTELEGERLRDSAAVVFRMWQQLEKQRIALQRQVQRLDNEVRELTSRQIRAEERAEIDPGSGTEPARSLDRMSGALLDRANTLSVTLQPLSLWQQFTLEAVRFYANRTEWLPRSELELIRLYDLLVQYPSLRLEIGVHTHGQLTQARALELSGERARAIKAYLVNRGVARDRLSSRAYGKSIPIADNASRIGRSYNQRVTIRILER